MRSIVMPWLAFVIASFSLAVCILLIAQYTATPLDIGFISKPTSGKSIQAQVTGLQQQVTDLKSLIVGTDLKLHYSSDVLGLSFVYPVKWGVAELTEQRGDYAGEEFYLKFGDQTSPGYLACGATIDFSTARGKYFCDNSSLPTKNGVVMFPYEKPQRYKVSGGEVALMTYQDMTKIERDLDWDELGPEYPLNKNTAYVFVPLKKKYQLAIFKFDLSAGANPVTEQELKDFVKSIEIK